MKIIISDIHGCYYTLQKLLNKLNFKPQSDTLICLGDMCDRGKYTNKVWQFFKSLQEKYSQHIVLTGNHENMFLLAVDEAMYSQSKEEVRKTHYLKNGGLSTLKSFYPQATEEQSRQYFRQFATEYKQYRQWLKGLRFKYEDNQFYYVHAGVDFNQTYQKQNVRDLIWIREPFLSTNQSYDKPVVHGHTPVQDAPFYEHLSNRINIDGGCVYGGVLTALVVDEQNQLSFVTQTYQQKDIAC